MDFPEPRGPNQINTRIPTRPISEPAAEGCTAEPDSTKSPAPVAPVVLMKKVRYGDQSARGKAKFGRRKVLRLKFSGGGLGQIRVNESGLELLDAEMVPGSTSAHAPARSRP